MLNKIKAWVRSFWHWSEKYAGTDLAYVAEGGFWLTMGQIAVSASSFLLSVAFANFLAPEHFGNYRYFISLGGILSIFTLTEMNIAVTRAAAQGYEGVLQKSIKAKLSWGLLSMAAGIIGAFYYLETSRPDFAAALLIVGIATPLLETLGMYEALLQGKKLFGVSTRYFIITQGFSLASLLIAVFLRAGLPALLLAYFLPRIILRFFFLKRSISFFQANTALDSESIPYGKKLSLISIIGTVADYLDRVIIFNFLGPAEVAIYSFAAAPPEQLKTFLRGIQTLALPKFSVRKTSEIQQTLVSKIIIFFFLILGAVSLYILAAPFLFRLFFPKYLEAVPYTRLYALTVLLAPGALATVFFESQKKIREKYYASLFSGISKITLLLPLTYFYGIYGTIFAILVVKTLNFFFSLFLAKDLWLFSDIYKKPLGEKRRPDEI